MTVDASTGLVTHRSKENIKHKFDYEVFSSTDFIAQIAQHIPDPGAQMVRYYGWYSNKMRGQRARRAGVKRNDDAPEPPARTSAHCQRLIRKVYEADPLLYPDCGVGIPTRPPVPVC